MYWRHLPHLSPTGKPIFITWRLHGSLPPNRHFPNPTESSGRQFAVLDRLLDNARSGPTYLKQPAIANMMVEVLQYAAHHLHYYTLHAFTIMPNHVHVLLTPHVPLPKLTRCIKGFSAKRANELLGLTGTTFWQEESYDHSVRNQSEFETIRRYILNNPVRAGLVREPEDYRWSHQGDREVTRRPGGPPYSGSSTFVR